MKSLSSSPGKVFGQSFGIKGARNGGDSDIMANMAFGGVDSIPDTPAAEAPASGAGNFLV